jgi:Multiubiquitin
MRTLSRLATEEITVAETETRRDIHIEIAIDARHYEVNEHQMTGAELLTLAGIPEGNQLFREVSGRADDQPVRSDETVKLHQGEKFYAVPVGNFG